MSAVKGDFTSFTFRVEGVTSREGIHSSELGITRVSSGDRYDETLQSEINDKTVEVPGMDGHYYFGSDYGPREIEISIAYDSLTETQLRRLRRIFGQKQIGELIFDERPYKKYLVKISSPIELSYVCFDEAEKEPISFDGIYGPTEVMRPTGQTTRVYKGDGSIKFTAYYPFAKSAFKVLPFTYEKTTDESIIEGKKYFILINNEYKEVSNPVTDFLDSYYERVNAKETNDWAVSSGILSVNAYDYIDLYSYSNADSEGTFHLYNAGDIKTGFRLYCPRLNDQAGSLEMIYKPFRGDGIDTESLSISNLVIDENDMGIIINTDNNLIEGVTNYSFDRYGNISYKTTGRIYNNYIDSGHFFKLETNDAADEATLTVTGSLASQSLDIYYDYLYF